MILQVAVFVLDKHAVEYCRVEMRSKIERTARPLYCRHSAGSGVGERESSFSISRYSGDKQGCQWAQSTINNRYDEQDNDPSSAW